MNARRANSAGVAPVGSDAPGPANQSKAAAILYLLFFLSGAAALGYQMIWVRMFAAGLGHDVIALIAVVSAFFGGMALGAWALGKAMGMGGGRVNSESVRWYGWLQVIVGMWGATTAFSVDAISHLALRLSGPSTSDGWRCALAFGIAAITLLPATAAMGATVPAMERALARCNKVGRAVGAFYAANTLGAVVGTLAGAFWLMPWLGFRGSILALAALSTIVGFMAVAAGRSERAAGAKSATGPSGPDAGRGHRLEARAEMSGGNLAWRRLAVAAFGIGFLGLAAQWVGVRLLCQVLENTLYSYAGALAVYLCGMALGGAVYQRCGSGWAFRRTLIWSVGGMSLAWLAGVRSATALRAFYDACRDALGDRMAGVLMAEMSTAALIFALPTFFMGLLYSHLIQATAPVPGGVGRAAAINVMGAVAAIPSAGLWLLPGLGSKTCALMIAAGYLLLLWVVRTIPKKWEWAAVVLPVMFAVLWLAPANLQLVDLPPGARVREYRESAYGTVAVVQTSDGHRSLRVNNRLQMGGTAAALAERRQAHLPLILHPHPQRALFLGPGTGITLGAAAEHPGLEIDGVELVPAIVELMPAFAPENGGVFTNRLVHLFAGDARRFVRTTAHRYDVVVADLFHPAQDGAGFLYTHEHFQAVRQCLNSGGLFCQWLPLHQLGRDELKGIVRTFLASFPRAWAVMLHFNVDIPVLGLLGAETNLWDASALERRLADLQVRPAARTVGLERPIQILGCLSGDAVSLTRYADDARMSTDDRPAILYSAPYHTAKRHLRSSEVLLEYLKETESDRARLAQSVTGASQTLVGQVQAFLEARDLYLCGLVEEGDGNLTSAIDLYLAGAQRSLYFTAAYARCVTIIQVMARADRGQALELFRRLEAAQPAQPLGKQILGPLLEEKPAAEKAGERPPP